MDKKFMKPPTTTCSATPYPGIAMAATLVEEDCRSRVNSLLVFSSSGCCDLANLDLPYFDVVFASYGRNTDAEVDDTARKAAKQAKTNLLVEATIIAILRLLTMLWD